MRYLLAAMCIGMLCVSGFFGSDSLLYAQALQGQSGVTTGRDVSTFHTISSSQIPLIAATECDPKKDIMLNTNIPFVGRCIKRSTGSEGGGGEGDSGESYIDETTITNVFPKMIGAFSRITMTAIIIIGFLGILLGGFMIASDGAFGTKAAGRKLIVSVIAGLILLGASGVILNLINPQFFGTAS